MIQNLEQNEKKEVTLLSKGTSFFGWTIEYTFVVLFNICDIVKFFERSTKFGDRLFQLIQIFKFLNIFLMNKTGSHLREHYLRITCPKKKSKGERKPKVKRK